jgi:hypothetical protein
MSAPLQLLLLLLFTTLSTTTAQNTKRVVNGEFAQVGQFPFAAALLRRQPHTGLDRLPMRRHSCSPTPGSPHQHTVANVRRTRWRRSSARTVLDDAAQGWRIVSFVAKALPGPFNFTTGRFVSVALRARPFRSSPVAATVRPVAALGRVNEYDSSRLRCRCLVGFRSRRGGGRQALGAAQVRDLGLPAESGLRHTRLL